MMDIPNLITAGVLIIAIGAVLILSQVISDVRLQGATFTLQSSNRIRFIIVVVIGALVIGIGCFVVILEAVRNKDPITAPSLPHPPTPVSPTPPELPHLTRGTFTFPTNGQYVNGTPLLARGSVENLSSMSLLCIVKASSSNHWEYAAQSDNGEWTANVLIGPENINRPHTFTLILATATQSAAAELRSRRQDNPDYYADYGLGPTLPSGIEKIVEVVIVRQS